MILLIFAVLDIYLDEQSYEASESDGYVEMSVCKNGTISSHPSSLNTIIATVSMVTVEEATNSGGPLPASIPQDNAYSPNRAGTVCLKLTNKIPMNSTWIEPS